MELLIVIVIMAIVAAVVIPSYGGTIADLHVQAAAERIRADLEWARRHAISASVSQTVEFDSDGYALPGMRDLNHPGQPHYVDLSGDQYGVTLVAVDFGGDAEIVFDGYGIPDSSGSVVVQFGNHVRTVSVDPALWQARVTE